MTNEPSNPPASSSFSTKEMLVRLETIVDRIEMKLDAKADKRALDAVEIRVVAVEAAANLRLLALESKTNGDDAVGKYKRWLLGVTIAALATAGTLLALLLNLHT